MERVAQGRTLDGLLDSFARVVRGLAEAPSCTEGSTTQNDDSAPPSPSAETPAPLADEVALPPKPKGKRNLKKKAARFANVLP